MNQDQLTYIEDDIDLFKIIASDNDVKSQYVIFQNKNGQYYGVNIEFINEIVRFEQENFIANCNNNEQMYGSLMLNTQRYTLLDFNKYLSTEETNLSQLQLVLIALYEGNKYALCIDEAYDLIHIRQDEIKNNEEENIKSLGIAKIQINGRDVWCTIVNMEHFFQGIL